APLNMLRARPIRYLPAPANKHKAQPLRRSRLCWSARRCRKCPPPSCKCPNTQLGQREPREMPPKPPALEATLSTRLSSKCAPLRNPSAALDRKSPHWEKVLTTLAALSI